MDVAEYWATMTCYSIIGSPKLTAQKKEGAQQLLMVFPDADGHAATHLQ